MRDAIFIVDDSAFNLNFVERGLQEYYNVFPISSGEKLFQMLEGLLPALILLDIEMVGMNGFEVLGKLKANSRFAHIPVVFLTGRSDEATEAKGFEMGVVDFISKPFTISVLRNRIATHIGIDRLVKTRTAELEAANETMEKMHYSLLFILADLVENRDQNTGGHVDRTVQYANVLTNALMEHGVYADEIRTWNLDSVLACVALHDVGKISITDVILNKPDQLTADEYEEMKSHTVKGAEIINRVITRIGDDKFLYSARLFAEFHHECWDGSGYPHRLKGLSIPLQGRIMAIADVYDALVSDRPYKKGFTDEKAVEIIMEGAGTKFDPKIADVFFQIRDKFKSIREEYGNA